MGFLKPCKIYPSFSLREVKKNVLQGLGPPLGLNGDVHWHSRVPSGYQNHYFPSHCGPSNLHQPHLPHLLGSLGSDSAVSPTSRLTNESLARMPGESLGPISINVNSINGNSGNTGTSINNNLSPKSPCVRVTTPEGARSASPIHLKVSPSIEEGPRSSGSSSSELINSRSSPTSGVRLQSPTFSAIHPALLHSQAPFFSAAAASLFLNSPLIPPSQWLYSQIYGHSQILPSAFTSGDFISPLHPRHGLPAPEPKRPGDPVEAKAVHKRISSRSPTPVDGQLSAKRSAGSPASPKRKSPMPSPTKRLLTSIKPHKAGNGETSSTKSSREVWRPY
ncbi:hypothetical protein RUM43_014810 [Polyplax serrata]|uniref:Uncharacterized protein n=1 Tax=Polyplax serrata TaxID=468196 RepID=A0AAN8P412_POLSC